MIVFDFGLDDLARLRLAISPLSEVAASLRAVQDPTSAALHVPWITQARKRLEGLDLRPLLALTPPRGYYPDFLIPPPSSPVADVAEDLEQVRRTPTERVRVELGHVRPRAWARPYLERFAADPRRAVRELADLLEAFWERAHAPTWPRVLALLQADVQHRARRLAEGGAAAVLQDLHPAVVWRGDRLEVHKEHESHLDLAGRGLLLVPSAFSTGHPAVVVNSPWQPTLFYPARGRALLWHDPPAASDGLARVLGRTRAQLLVRLAAPASTTELARELGLAAGGVNEHLTALAAAGLLSAQREGRSVLYVRTEVADALVAAGS